MSSHEVTPGEDVRFEQVVSLPKVEIFVTDVCNNRCAYCTTGWDNAEAPRGTLKHVRREVIRSHLEAHFQKGARRVLFQGGEPTVRRDLGELVADAVTVGYQATTVFTNARAASSPLGARRLAEMKVTWFQVSIQGGTAEAHDASVAAPRAFGQTIEGTRRLIGLGQRVKVNGVLTRHLLDTLGEFTDLMIALRPEEVGLDVVRPSPAFGPGRASYAELLPALSGYSAALRDAVLKMNRAGVVARLISCPPCLVPGAEQYVSEEQETTVTQIPTGDFMHKLTQRRSLQTKAPQCAPCALNASCPGLFGAYVEAHGFGELHPYGERPTAQRERPSPQPAVVEGPLTLALRDLFVRDRPGTPYAVQSVTAARDGAHELRCTTPRGEQLVTISPRGQGPAFETTLYFAVSYQSRPGAPPVDPRLLSAVVRALRAAEPQLIFPPSQ